ncbi:SdpI family protein [Mollicutes bacterium LVI A0039]|nr:SdpI family protein [Mollicutes bacterium LVI A0039]
MRKSSYLILVINVISIGIGMYVLRYNSELIAYYAIDSSGSMHLAKSNLILIGFIPFIVVGTMDLIATIEAEEIKPFIRYYDRLKFLLCFAFQLLYILIIASQLLNINEKLILGFTAAFIIFYVGYTLQHISHNQVIGFKNRWTLSEPYIWHKVHMRAQKLLYGLALIVVVLTVFQHVHVAKVLVILTMAIVIYLIFFSYSESKKVQYQIQIKKGD